MASQLEGVAELTAKLNELGVKLAARELRGTVKEAMKLAEHEARARIPQGSESHRTYKGRLVSPGFAVANLAVEASFNRRTGAAEARLGVRSEAYYAVQFLELGTSKTAAQPWLRPALEAAGDPILDKIAAELRRRIDRIARKKAKAAGL